MSMHEEHPKASEEVTYVDPVIEEYKKHVDRTLIRENLKLTPQQRLERLEALVRGIEEMNRAGREARRT